MMALLSMMSMFPTCPVFLSGYDNDGPDIVDADAYNMALSWC